MVAEPDGRVFRLDEAELRGIAEFACRVAGRSTEKSGGISAITEMPDEVFMG